jgi:hypothetical protein
VPGQVPEPLGKLAEQKGVGVDVDVDELVGPFYRAEDLAAWKGITLEAVDELVRERRLLALTSSSGTLTYPKFQFGPTGELLPYLAEVLELVDPDGVDGLGSALWLNRQAERFEGLTPVQKLRAGGAVDVLAAARQIQSS